MRSILAILLIATLLLPVSGAIGLIPVQQVARPLSLQEYWSQVEQTRQTVSGLPGKPDVAIRSRLDTLAGEWETITRVELPGGTILPVDPGEMTALFRQEPPAIATILARLEALQQVRAGFPDGKYSQKDIDSLAKILADPRFQWAESKPSSPPQWLENVWSKIQAWLNRLFGNLSGSVNVNLLGVEQVLTWVLAILLAGILAYAGRGLWLILVGEAELGEAGMDGEDTLTSETALRRADTLSGAGNYRSAVRYLYLSALLLLDERRLLRYDRSRTNREYLCTLSGTPALAYPLRAVIDIFDRVWYGFEAIDQATYQEYVEQVGILRKQKP